MADASERVVSQAVGAAMIRPASRAPNRLYLTMHTPGGVVWHVEIRELGPTSQNLRLAPPLEISLTESKKYVYDDLDELAARFVDPISSMMKSLSRHRKWIGGGPPNGPAKGWEDSLSGVKGELAKQKHDNPKTVAYGLAADLANPGMFYIGRIIGTTPRRERFSVLPDGFYFRKETFGHVDALLHAFKRNPDYLERQEHQRRSQNQQTGGPSQQASASMQELQQHSMATQYGQQQPYGMQQPHVYAQQQQQQQQQQQYPSAYYGGGVLPPAAAAAAAGPYGGPPQEYGSHGGGNPIAAAGGGFDGAGWYAPGSEQYGGPVMPHQHVPPQYPPNGPPPSYAAGQYGGRR
jgi:transcription elongation factor SPT6